MCKFVDYLVPTDVHANIIKDITKRVAGFERKPLPYDDNYNLVEFWRGHCNCGSVVSSRKSELAKPRKEHYKHREVIFDEEEHEDYKRISAFITSILKHCDHMKIYSYWSDLDEQHLKKHKRTISQNDLTIDILAQLPYNTCLIINK